MANVPQEVFQSLRALRQRMEQLQRQQSQGVKPPPLPTQASKRKGKGRQASAPQAAPRPAPKPIPPRIETPETVIAVERSQPRSEIAQNVRMLLQRNGVREAFVLAEILGKPKALD